jgi:hypothetical protein
MGTPFSWADPEVEASRWQWKFEDQRVRMVLEAFGLAEVRFELLDDHAKQYGTRRLTFGGFRERFPSFPVLLEARYVGAVADRVDPGDLFRRFANTLVTDLYLEAYARHIENADGRPVGLVIPFAGVRSGVVVHNGAFDGGTTRLVHRVPGGQPPHVLTAEPFDGFLKYVAGAGWTPGEDVVQPKVAAEAPGLEAAVAPWMVRRLGSGPAAYLLGWFRAVLDSPCARAREWVRRVDGGGRRLAMTCDEMADACGLDRAAVKRALARLKDEGLIRTSRRERRTWVEVLPRGRE